MKLFGEMSVPQQRISCHFLCCSSSIAFSRSLKSEKIIMHHHAYYLHIAFMNSATMNSMSAKWKIVIFSDANNRASLLWYDDSGGIKIFRCCLANFKATPSWFSWGLVELRRFCTSAHHSSQFHLLATKTCRVWQRALARYAPVNSVHLTNQFHEQPTKDKIADYFFHIFWKVLFFIEEHFQYARTFS